MKILIALFLLTTLFNLIYIYPLVPIFHSLETSPAARIEMPCAANKSVNLALRKDLLEKFRASFYADKKNVLSQNVCSRTDPFDVALSRKQLEETSHVFNYKVTRLFPSRFICYCYIFETFEFPCIG